MSLGTQRLILSLSWRHQSVSRSTVELWCWWLLSARCCWVPSLLSLIRSYRPVLFMCMWLTHRVSSWPCIEAMEQIHESQVGYLQSVLWHKSSSCHRLPCDPRGGACPRWVSETQFNTFVLSTRVRIFLSTDIILHVLTSRPHKLHVTKTGILRQNQIILISPTAGTCAGSQQQSDKKTHQSNPVALCGRRFKKRLWLLCICVDE